MYTKDNPTHKSIFDRPRIYREQLLTVDDLADFKRQLLFEIKNMIKELVGQPTKKWLKTHEVRKLLNISGGTIQTLRTNGTLPYKKVGHIIYYDIEDIERMLDARSEKVG
ncbi:MAG TPA: helix-turn-helix domain-containing protein [Puia sp.]|nr:helix-turn-helix domain-containing protein [Puia sp.]